MQKPTRGLALAAGLAALAMPRATDNTRLIVDEVSTFDLAATRTRATHQRPGQGKRSARSKRELEDATRFHSWIHARKNMRGIPGNKLRKKIERRQLGLARPR